MAADAFDVLGLAPSLELDISVLEQRYRDLQRQLHPDKFAQASSSERRSALSRAMSVNDAYRVLKDELKRAEAWFATNPDPFAPTFTTVAKDDDQPPF